MLLATAKFHGVVRSNPGARNSCNSPRVFYSTVSGRKSNATNMLTDDVIAGFSDENAQKYRPYKLWLFYFMPRKVK